MAKLKPVDVLTPPVRISWPALFAPRPTVKGGDVLKFQASFLLPPDVDLAPFNAAILAAAKDKFGANMPKFDRANLPVHDCADKSGLAGYEAGWRWIAAKSGYKPAVVDQQGVEIIDANKIYAGCWVRAHLNAFAWERMGKKGVSFGLNAVQFVKDDERLDGRVSASDVFEPIAFDTADAASDELDSLIS